MSRSGDSTDTDPSSRPHTRQAEPTAPASAVHARPVVMPDWRPLPERPRPRPEARARLERGGRNDRTKASAPRRLRKGEIEGDSFGRSSHRTPNDRLCTHRASNVHGGARRAVRPSRRCGRDHPDVADRAELRNHCVGHARRVEILSGVPGGVRERQHGERVEGPGLDSAPGRTRGQPRPRPRQRRDDVTGTPFRRDGMRGDPRSARSGVQESREARREPRWPVDIARRGS